MKRRVAVIFAGVLLLMFGAIWIWMCFEESQCSAVWGSSGGNWEVSLDLMFINGREDVRVEVGRLRMPGVFRTEAGAEPVVPGWTWEGWGTEKAESRLVLWPPLDVHYYRLKPHDDYYIWLVEMSPWTGVAVSGVPVGWWLMRRRWRKAREGYCGGCGYDLRASEGRCPECGREAERGRAEPV